MHLWGRCLSLVAAVLAIVAAHGTAGPAEARTFCVGKESVLLRAGPSWRQDPVGSLPAGTCGIEVVSKCQSGWCEVALADRRGWIESRLVSVPESAVTPRPPPAKAAPPPAREATPASPIRQAAPPPSQPRPAPPARQAPPPASASTPTDRDNHCVMGVRPGDTLRIRSGPSAEHRELGGIPPDACDVAVGSPCQGAWCPVTYRGLKGWSNASYLRPPWMR